MPLLERLRYLTIVSDNLDEFFEIRVAELQELARLDTVTGVSIGDKLDAIAAARRNVLLQRQYHLLNRC